MSCEKGTKATDRRVFVLNESRHNIYRVEVEAWRRVGSATGGVKARRSFPCLPKCPFNGSQGLDTRLDALAASLRIIQPRAEITAECSPYANRNRATYCQRWPLRPTNRKE